ncbi:carboxymuconolactone decarboxylase family protein [Anaerovorax odorimutans]|uniref:Carboxymuconolactone decarboxylase family protein n=1 Tax=Anaerovorax odorimutans TaxID=109327 RepID=A0ABT1RJ88_9FIRM|nr:carboxymuconolactone decarboxylase family protein [Anaerovorax odorimutans]MCQ4635236.1 carboxymuconolactone decarboxylase family protein [Anaerovorax odorimutans]
MTYKKVTAGHEALGEFAPKFAELNDDVLFGQVWSREQQLSPRDRSLITVTALMSSGILDSSLRFHMSKAKENGITKEEIAEVLTQLAFYSGWPKAWAAFNMAKEIWKEEETDCEAEAAAFDKDSIFPIGKPNDAFAKYFTGQSYLEMLTTDGVPAAHVTFEPGCRNWGHIHHKGGQILLVTGGRGYYQEWGQSARALHPGDVVNIAPEIKHWHGAAKDSWFSHIAIEVPAEGGSNEWVGPVTDDEYKALK